ncbi:MAG: PaaI family thioesterase [Thermaerobacter sp.]|nr:PaaI family thioesterase [Thermaerobacter sp.]
MPTPSENHDLAGCFACGTDSSRGMHLQFRADGEGVMAETQTDSSWVGWQGLVHGGLLATLMDEAVGWAVAAIGKTGLTARLSVRYLLPVAPFQRLIVRAWVQSSDRRGARTGASIELPTGRKVATAEALMLFVKDLPRSVDA